MRIRLRLAFPDRRSVLLFVPQKISSAMQPLLHALNIGTLATWLSVAGFGGVGVLVGRAAHEPIVTNDAGVELVQGEIEIESFETAVGSAGEEAEATESSELVDLPAPPEIMPAVESELMPDVPDLPVAELKKVSESIKVAAKPKKVSVAARASTGIKSASGNVVAAGGQASTMSSAARLAAGRMPAPRYPSEARSKGQSGTVTIEFTVDASGRVSSAHVCSPCPWAVLNDEALRAVRNWKFPPGGVVTYKKPIVFKLRNS